jgi:hypothetical protein
VFDNEWSDQNHDFDLPPTRGGLFIVQEKKAIAAKSSQSAVARDAISRAQHGLIGRSVRETGPAPAAAGPRAGNYDKSDQSFVIEQEDRSDR